MSFGQATISNYFAAIVEDAKKEIHSTPDDRVIGMQQDDWLNYLVANARLPRRLVSCPARKAGKVAARLSGIAGQAWN